MIKMIHLLNLYWLDLIPYIIRKMFEAIIYLLQGKTEEDEKYKR